MFNWLNYTNVKEADGLWFVMSIQSNKPVMLFSVPCYKTKEEAEELSALLNAAFEAGVDEMR